MLQAKVVIVGLTAEGLTQTVPTPFGAVDIHEFNAKTLHTIMSGTSIKRWDIANQLEILDFFSFWSYSDCVSSQSRYEVDSTTSIISF